MVKKLSTIGLFISLFASLLLLSWHTLAIAEETKPLFPVVQSGKWGYIDRSGNIVIKPQFDGAENFSDGYARAFFQNPKPWWQEWICKWITCVPQGQWRYIDEKGNVVTTAPQAVKPQSDEGRDVSENLTPVTVNGKYGYIGKNGRVVVQPHFEAAWKFSEGLARVRLDGKCGYIDQSGKVVISPQFEICGDFSEGLAGITVFDANGRFKDGYIDKSGNVVIQPRFDRSFNFHEGLAQVRINRKLGYIDKTGKYVWEPTN